MPAGFESMVLTAWFDRTRSAGQYPAPGRCLKLPCLGLARAVLQHDSRFSMSRKDSVTRSLSRAAEKSGQLVGGVVTVRRDDVAGREWFADATAMVDRVSGIVGLRPLQGMDDRTLALSIPTMLPPRESLTSEPPGSSTTGLTPTARVLGLRTRSEGVRKALLSGIVRHLVNLAGESSLVILAYVNADDVVVQAELDSLGFLPTAYLPGMISDHQGREAAVQYTRLIGQSPCHSVRFVTAMDWLEARKVIEQVLRCQSGKRPAHLGSIP